jgi:hypothetical protein
MRKMTPCGKTAQTVKAVLCDEKARTVAQLVDEAILTAPTIRDILRKMHATKQVYIADWTHSDYGRPLPIWKIGYAPDAQPPDHKKRERPKSERQLAAEERTRAQRIEEELQQPAFRHPWDEWLFGPPPVTASTHQFTRRICRMDMTVTADEMEAV